MIGDRYPYALQGRPMGRTFGAIAAGMGVGFESRTSAKPSAGLAKRAKTPCLGIWVRSLRGLRAI